MSNENHLLGTLTSTTPPCSREYSLEEEEFSVPYLSPIVLRKELESLISQGKSSLLQREALVTEKPIIYWNLVWYFTRLELPTYLPLLSLRRLSKVHPRLQKVRSCVHLLCGSLSVFSRRE